MSKLGSSLYLQLMNYLAHIYLSGENELRTIGNFMADAVKGKKYLKYPEDIQDGIILHRAIDYYTDTHPTVYKSVHRLFPEYKHYSGIIVDIYYDHFLAKNWDQFCNTDLKSYTESFFDILKKNYDYLPSKTKRFAPYLIQDNWLLTYADIDGIDRVLNGMDIRTGRKSGMGNAGKELRTYYSDFEKEFFSFFEELEAFSKEKIIELKKKRAED